jgi:aldehyde:ferredoxin oxidoreductase
MNRLSVYRSAAPRPEGSMQCILRVDLSTRTIYREPIPPAYQELGGRGLTCAIVSAEVPPTADPLGEDNRIVLAPGILAGTSVPNSGRLSVGGKSPLTGTIKEANSGGAVAQKLARLGIAAVIIQGVSAEPVTIAISREAVSFESAANLWGKGSVEVVESLKREQPRGAFVTIGPAGEKKLKAAAVIVTSQDHLLRAAARGGLGAVLGSKKVKAITIDDSGGEGVPVADSVRFKTATAAFTSGVLQHPLMGGFRALGTLLLVGPMNEMKGLATRNFSRGVFEEADKISGEALAKLLGERKGAAASHRCMAGCVISCSQVFTDEEGKVVTSGLEFETVGLVGSNCEIGDLDVIARIDGLCDDLGLDTIDVGGAVGVAMEAGRIAWGDGQRVIEVLESIRRDDPFGLLIGNGCTETGKALGVTRVPTVKGQALSAYDPRILKGTGVTYATSPMGADHTCGNALPSPTNPSYDPGSAVGQHHVSEFLQSFFATVDTLGICLFASLPMLDMPELQGALVEAVSAKLGKELPEGYLFDLGRKVIVAERMFNRRAGFTSADDRLPQFFRDEAIAPGGAVFDVEDDDLDAIFVEASEVEAVAGAATCS